MLGAIKRYGHVIITTLLLLMPASLNAQDPQASQIREMIGAQLSTGDYDGARQTLASVSRNAADFLLLEVEILTSQGKIDEAIKLLRDVTAKYPDLAFARVKLAQLLVANRQLDSATYHFEILRDQATEDGARAFFTDQIQQIQDLQVYGLSANFSLTPSSNINNASDRETEELFFGIIVDLPEELQPQFGWRFSVGANGYYNVRIKDQHSLQTSFYTQTVLHTVETIDYSNFTLGVSYKFQNARHNFSVGPFVQRYIGDGETYLAEYTRGESKATIVERDEDFTVTGVAANWRYILTPRQSIALNYKYSDRRYDDQERYKSRTSYEHSLGASYSYFLTKQHLGSMNVNYTRHVEAGNREDWESFNSYTGLGAGLSLTSKFENQWQTEVGFGYRHEAYDELYPLTNVKREDENFRFNFSVLNGNWTIGSLAPKLNCSYNVRTSNVEAYDTEGFDCGVSLSYQF